MKRGIDWHIRESEECQAEGVREATQVLKVSLGTLAISQLAAGFFDASLPATSFRDNLTQGCEKVGLAAAGLVAGIGVVTVGCEGVKALYHEMKVWQLERKETKAEQESHQFTPVSINPPTQLNGNL